MQLVERSHRCKHDSLATENNFYFGNDISLRVPPALVIISGTIWQEIIERFLVKCVETCVKMHDRNVQRFWGTGMLAQSSSLR